MPQPKSQPQPKSHSQRPAAARVPTEPEPVVAVASPEPPPAPEQQAPEDAPLERQPDAPTDVGKFVVTAAGACFKVDGDPANIGHGLHGQVVELVDSEATRLIMLGAVRAASPEDVEHDRARRAMALVAAAEQLAGPADNPYGGRTVGNKTLEQHAVEQIALAKKAGTLPPDTKVVAAAKKV